MKNKIPFVDLFAQYQNIKDEIDTAISDVIATSSFIRGPHVDKFEQVFSDLMERKYCVSCANGTDALYIALKALRLRPGDEVIVPSHSWISTSETVTQAGGTVVFCDVEENTLTIDPEDIQAKITSNTVGIIPVHLFGQAADMDPVMAVARKSNLWVLEDCAQAHMARYKGKLVGTFGDAAAFSFYPGKNLGAMGDAGAVLTNQRDLAENMAKFARHGGLNKGEHLIEGINSRMDGLQAAILTVKLRYLAEWTRARQAVASRYNVLLSEVDSIHTPFTRENSEHVYHLYVVRHEFRDALADHLRADGIQTVINYPVALPFLPAYQRLMHKPKDFPVAYGAQSKILSLPIFPEMTESQIMTVVKSVHRFVSTFTELRSGRA